MLGVGLDVGLDGLWSSRGFLPELVAGIPASDLAFGIQDSVLTFHRYGASSSM